MNVGLYILESEISRRIPPDKVCSLEKETFPSLISKGLQSTPIIRIPTTEIGDIESLRLADKKFSQKSHL